MDDSTFETLANQTLESLLDAIEDQLGDHLDVDLEGGILTIELDSGGQYVINKHGPNRQIWLSSPKSGASHYGYDAAARAWVGTRDGANLLALLESELSALTGETLRIG